MIINIKSIECSWMNPYNNQIKYNNNTIKYILLSIVNQWNLVESIRIILWLNIIMNELNIIIIQSNVFKSISNQSN